LEGRAGGDAAEFLLLERAAGRHEIGGHEDQNKLKKRRFDTLLSD
jgi:hypothetical protein